MLRVSGHFSRTITIDGESVQLRIARFNREQQIAFATEFDFINREQSAFDAEVQRFGRRHLATVAAELGVTLDALPAEEIPGDVQLAGLFEATLTPEDRDARRAREQALAQRGSAFTIQSVTDFITVEPQQIIDDDTGREILSGADLVGRFMAREDVLANLMAAIVEENRLSADQKKILSSLRASPRTSAPPATTDGPRPDATATGAAPSTTARTGPASALSETSLSGATTPSHATDARSSASPRTSKRRLPGSAPRTASPSKRASRTSDAPPSPEPAGSATRTRG